MVAFVVSQNRLAGRGGFALFDPVVFRAGGLRSGLGTQLAFWCSQASFYLTFALYLQNGRHLSPLNAALVFTGLAGSYFVVSLRAPGLTRRFGRDLVVVGAMLVAAGDMALWLFVVHFGVTGPVGLLVPGLLLVGAGQGLCITPLTSTVLAHVTPEHAGAVSGALSTMQQLGNSLGVAITGVVFFAVLPRGYANAFAWSLVELTVLLVVVAILARLLPARRANLLPRGSRGRSEATSS